VSTQPPFPPEQSLPQPDPEYIVDQPRRSADPAGWQTQLDPVAARANRNGQAEMNDVTWAPALVEPADEDLDLIAEVDHRPSRTTMLLIAGILASLAFIGGVVVQKHYGETTSGGTAGAAAGFGARTGGYGAAGGFPGGGQGFPGAAGGAPAGTGADAAGGTGGGTAGGATTTATPVVVGKVTKLSGSRLTVKNLGGKSVKVKVPEGATITLVAGKSLTALKVGATVSVAGKSGADGTVTATAITVRS
jgi:hypothetical protein